jgi:hypothetical protein
MSQRAITVFGLVAAGGAGYYLYNAGGDPKVAQKMAQGAQLQYYGQCGWLTRDMQPMHRKLPRK